MSDNIYKNQKWGVHIVGPDNVIPCHSFEQAVDQANEFNLMLVEHILPKRNNKFDPLVYAQVDIWESIAGPDTQHDPDSVDWKQII